MPAILRALTQNWKLKLLALTLAVLLWVVVSAEEVTSRWIDIPLQVRVTDPEYLLRQEGVPREVSVRFSGPRRELIDLRFRRPPLVLNILDVEDERQSVDLHARMVQLPSQLAVNVIDMQPSSIDLRFTRVETRVVPVRLRLSEPLPVGWVVVDSLALRPGRVRISGPEPQIGAIDSINTLPIALPVVDTAFSVVVPLDTTPVVGMRISARRVQLTGRLDRVLERTYANVPVSTGPGITLRPSMVDVRLRGPRSVLEGLTQGSIRVVVSIDSIPARIPPDGVAVPLRLEGVPPGVQGELTPASARLFPERMILDTVPVERQPPAADTLAVPAPDR